MVDARGEAIGLSGFEKRRPPATPGSIPAVLDMFHAEVRFYNEVAPHLVGVRVPRCEAASIMPQGGTHLVLEDLSAWQPGGDAVAVAGVLRRLHDQWTDGRAIERWPWLRPPGAAADLIGALYDRTWPALDARQDLTPGARRLGASLAGRVGAAEAAEGIGGPLTLVHGDASLRNVFTGPDGEIALVDWEDVRLARGVADLAWLLVSSVEPSRWDAVIDAYGGADGLTDVLPAAVGQELLGIADLADGDAAASDRIARVEAAAALL